MPSLCHELIEAKKCTEISIEHWYFELFYFDQAVHESDSSRVKFMVDDKWKVSFVVKFIVYDCCCVYIVYVSCFLIIHVIECPI